MVKKHIQHKNQQNIMEAIYIKLSVVTSNVEIDAIRNAGLLFDNIADAISLDKNDIEEIDESNYLSEIENIRNKYLK